MRKLTLAAIFAIVLTPGAAYARGGGGGHGFGGGGGHIGGGLSHGFGGGHFFFFPVGGTGTAIGWLVILALVIAYYAYRAWRRKQAQQRSLNTTSDRVAHRSDAAARERAASVEAQVDGLADVDATFDVEALKRRSTELYLMAQKAWTAQDRVTLRAILAPAIYRKWDEQLAAYAARGETNVVEVRGMPTVELVNVANRDGEVNDTVTFRITATLVDYVTTPYGVASRKDRSSRPVEYWTLRKNDSGVWIVAAIEQAEEGAHHLRDQIEIDTWDQKAVAREAVLDVAEKTTSRPEDVLSLTSIDWAAAADEAAGDLSVVDGRFDKSVLEVGIQEFLEEWQINDGSLDFTAAHTPNRTVMRSATITGIQVAELVSREPIVFAVDVTANGVYYEVDRRSEEVLLGDPHQSRQVRFRFVMQLDGRAWSVTGAHAAL